MDKVEARRIAEEVAQDLLTWPPVKIGALLEEEERREVVAPSGTVYSVVIEAVDVDEHINEAIVLVMVDDGGWSAFKPLVEQITVPIVLT